MRCWTKKEIHLTGFSSRSSLLHGISFASKIFFFSKQTTKNRVFQQSTYIFRQKCLKERLCVFVWKFERKIQLNNYQSHNYVLPLYLRTKRLVIQLNVSLIHVTLAQLTND